MASYKAPTNFGFMDRYAGRFVDGSEREEVALEQSRVNLERSRRAAAREDLADESLRLDVEAKRADAENLRRDQEGRTAFNSLVDEYRKTPAADRADTAVGSALNYTRAVSDVMTYVRQGNLPAAYAAYKNGLDDPSRKFADKHFVLGGTKPRDSAERDIQVGSASMRNRDFDALEVELPGGVKTNLKNLFLDGESWKTAMNPVFTKLQFTSDVQAAYQSEDAFVRDTVRSIVDPAITLRPDGRPGASVKQRGDFADFMAKNMDEYRRVLGDDGVMRLVADAMDCRLPHGTAIDAARVIYRSVADQLDNMNKVETVDRSALVREAISQYDRTTRIAVGRDGKVDPDAAGMMSKQMLWAADAGVTDFGNPAVRDAMEKAASFTVTLDRLGIPFLDEAYKAGAPLRRALGTVAAAAQNGTDVPDDNLYARSAASLSLALNLMSGGASPSGSKASVDPREGRGDYKTIFGKTTGNSSIDSALTKMTRTLVGDYLLPLHYRDDVADPRDALRSALADGGLADKWARDVGRALGFTADTSSYVVQRFIGYATAGGGLRAPNLPEMMVQLTQEAPRSQAQAKAQRELQRFLAAEGYGRQLFADQDAELTRHLMDPVVGLGFKNRDQVEAYLSDVRRRELAHVENGVGVGTAYASARNTGTYYAQALTSLKGISRPLPQVMLPDGRTVIAVPKDLAGQVERHPDFTGYSVDGGLLKEGSSELKDAIPVLTQFGGDLRKVALPELRIGAMVLPAAPAGLWSRDPDRFRSLMAQRMQLYQAAMKGAASGAQKTAKTSVESDGYDGR